MAKSRPPPSSLPGAGSISVGRYGASVNVVIQVKGRDAIPVRAIPFLTSWQLFTPDVLAKVLAQDDEVTAAHGMRELTAYRVEGGNVDPISAIWWRNFACRELKLLSDTISASQSSHDAGYQQWRWQSVVKLPAGVFVWRDEFVQGYERQLVRLMRAAWRDPDVEYPDHGEKVETPEEMQQRLKLDFEPFITDKAILATIVEGFETATDKTPGSKPAPGPDNDGLATREKLIAAFGSFTGMTKAWFDNVKDTPGLKAARRYAGTGGKNGAPPLFDPYVVMQWLLSPKRKKGTPISERTAWRMLKTHFQKSYKAHAIDDPNEGSPG